MPKKNTTAIDTENLEELEKSAEKDASPMARRHSEASIDEVNSDEEAEKGLSVEEGADADSVMPAEVAAVRDDNESAAAVNEKNTKKVATKKVSDKKAKVRSKNYHAAKAQIEAGKLYSLSEAVELVKKISVSKFDGSIEVHVKLTKKKNKGASESPKGLFHLPHGSGKSKNIIILDEARIDAIAQTKKIDFDIAIATPELMPKVGKIAKILGPKGKMPDPKSGTVTTDPQKAIDEINSGKVEYRIDAQNQIHQMIGKVSWGSEKLLENAKVVLSAFPKARLESVHLSASISPSVAVDVNSL